MKRDYPIKRSIAKPGLRRTPLLAAGAKWVRDDGYVLLLSVLFWTIFYQNFPSEVSGGNASSAAYAPNSLDRIIKIAMIALCAWMIAIRWRLARALIGRVNPGLLAFTVLAPLSMLWSIDQSATLLRFVSEIAVLMVCFGFALAGWHRRRFQQVVIPPVMLILLGSLAIGAVSPSLMIEVGNDIALKGSWHGLTYSKNGFGMLSAFGVIICSHAWFGGERRRFLPLVGTVIAFVCLTLSRSNTSMFATLLALSAMFLLLRVPVVKRRYTPHAAIGTATLIIIYELAIQGLIPGVDVLLSPVVGLTGKDTSFSARTHIWQIIKDHIKLSPYWGTGYGGYWVGPLPTSPSYTFMYEMSFYPTESHNGYLEMINDLGMIGLVCLLVFLAWYVRQCLQLMRTDRNQAVLFLGLLFFEMTVNMSESDWFSRTDTFAIFALASVSLSRGLLDADLRRGLMTSVAGKIDDERHVKSMQDVGPGVFH